MTSARRAQDKACIDQNNIDQALACLPIFLAGCKTLLITAGPTYCTRLWVRRRPALPHRARRLSPALARLAVRDGVLHLPSHGRLA